MREMTVREAASYLDDPETPAMLIDVRERDEYLPRHAHNAVNIPMSEFIARIAEAPTGSGCAGDLRAWPQKHERGALPDASGLYTGHQRRWRHRDVGIRRAADGLLARPRPLVTPPLPPIHHTMSHITAPIMLAYYWQAGIIAPAHCVRTLRKRV